MIKITTAGTYTFFSRSDDGTQLYIDGTLVVSNDGQHGLIDGSVAPITLSAGYHTILELYEQGNGAAGIEVDYQGPDTSNVRTIIPAGVLFHSGGTPTGAVNFLVNGVAIGNGTLSTVNGVTTASFTTTLQLGSDATTAMYLGDNNVGASTSTAATQLVVSQTVATGVSAFPGPADSGQTVTLTAAVVSSMTPGLTASYYNLSAAPTGVASAFSLPSGTPTANASLVATRTDAQVNVPNNYNGFLPTVAVSGLNATNVAAEWSGLIQITQAGLYTFYSSSDDGSLLYIDGNLVVSNDGAHTIADGTAPSIALSAGDHTLLELYEEGAGYAGLVLGYQGPDTGGLRDIIPANVLFHATATPTGTVTFNDSSSARHRLRDHCQRSNESHFHDLHVNGRHAFHHSDL